MGRPSGRAARVWVVALLIATAASVSTKAAAGEPAAPTSGVETPALALFREGRALLESQDYVGAAAKFEQSFRLDPGGGTKLNLALAYELGGRIASAWSAFQDALRMAQRDARPDRVDEAQTHLQRLEARLSRLRIVIPESARIAGLQVLVDGVARGDASGEIDAPLDPGTHQVEADAPGRRPWRASVAVGDFGDRREVVVTGFEDVPRPRPRSKLRSLAWITLSVGAAGLATAGATAAVAAANCPGGHCASSPSRPIDTYNSLRRVSTVSFWVGGGLSVAGLLLALLTPTSHEDGVSLVVSPRFVGLSDRF
jgi:hypothetical protein